MPFFTFFSRSFRFGLVASLYYLFLVLAVPAQAKVAFYLIEDTEDPSPSLAACMAVYTNGVLIEPDRNLWVLNYEIWEIFYEQKMLFCHKHGVIFPKGERVD